MKRFAIVLTLGFVLATGTTASFGRQGGRQQRPLNAPALLEVVLGLYINDLQQRVELTDDQFLKIASFLKEFVRESYDIVGPRKNRALAQLRQALMRGASEDELARLTKEYDQIDTDDHAARQKFFANVDPLLQVSQRARLRLHIYQKEQQLSRLMQISQNPALAPKPVPPPQKPSPN